MLRIATLIFFYFIANSLTVQLGWWTWMKGPANVDQTATWGTKGMPAPANTPASSYGPFYWQDSNFNFWAWGGGNRTGRGQADMWMYDIPTNMWTWKNGAQGLNSLATYGTQGVPAPTNVPAARQYGGASWIDNQNNLWLFGGNGWAPGNQNGEYAEMWRYNTTTNEWTWMHGPQGVSQPGSYGTQGVASATNYPPARREACAAWVDNNGIFWMFGGEANMNGPTQYYNDLWKYDPTTNMWTWVRGSATPNSNGSYGTMGVASPTNDPPARSLYSHWKSLNGDLWFFGGGNDQNKSYNDMWKYNIATNQWTWVRGSSTPNPIVSAPTKCVASNSIDPAPRYESRACWTDSCGNFWMFGGVDFTKSPQWGVYNDLWFYHVKNNTWTLASVNGTPSNGTIGVPNVNNRPTHRFGSAPFTDNKGNLWMFAGRDTTFGNGMGYSSHLSNIWRFFPDSICTRSTCIIVTANFTATNLTFCAPDTVLFTNLSSNSTSWLWNFGDGSTSTLQHPSHVYTNPGTYTVMLTAYNLPDSSTFTQTTYVTVYANATAAFTPSNDTICTGQSVNFSNASTNATTYNWNFGNGNTSSNATPTVTYNNPGTYTVSMVASNPGGCNDSTTHIILVTGAQVTAGATLALNCTTTNGQISATSTTPNVTYSWSGPNITAGGNTSTPTVNGAGTYIVTVTDPLSGCTNTDTVFVTSNTTVPNITGGPPASLNCTTPSATITASSSTSGVIYSWTGSGITSGANTNSATVNAPGAYTVTVTDPSNGCTNTATVNVTSTTPLPNVTAGPSLVLPCSPLSGTISASSTTNGVTYSWAGSGIVSGGTSNSPTVNQAGTYTVTVLDPATGCTNTAAVIVTNSIPPSITAGPTVTIPCTSPYPTVSVSSSVTTLTYSWSGPGIVSGATTATPTINLPGIYTVIITNASNGCTNSATVTANPPVLPNANAGPDVTITLGQNTTLTASGGSSYLWSPPTDLSCTSCISPLATPTITTTYCVMVTDANRCIDSACVTVTVEIPCSVPNDFTVPNAFSPNKDGLNDEFCLLGWDRCIKEFQAVIYNRWGDKVFESKDPFFCWDGTQLGIVFDAQVFVYYIRAEYFEQDEPIIKKGNITLLR